jgi:hypothetical protein
MILRDVVRDYEYGQTDADPLQVLYCYAGFNTSICSLLQNVSPDTYGVGVIVYFYARATKYSGNIQLTDLQYKTTGKLKFQVLNETNFEKETNLLWEDVILDVNAEYVDPTTITKKADIAAYQYHFISTEVEIREVSPMSDDDYEASFGGPMFALGETKYWFRATQSGTNPPSYTYYAKIKGTNVLFNLRCDATLHPQITPAFFDSNYGTENFDMSDCVGKVFHATGYVAAYFENFQLQLPNNYRTYNYIYAVE